MSVAAFASDLGAVFNRVIYDKLEELDVDDVPSHSDLSPDQKDKKMRAKRIIKLILPQLLDAAGKEYELGMLSAEEGRKEVEEIMNECVRPHPESIHFTTGGAARDGDSDDEGENQLLRRSESNGQQPNGVSAGNKDEDVEMTDAPEQESANKPESVGEVVKANGTSSPSAPHIKLQPSPDEDTGLTNGHNTRTTPLPALSNSGSTNPSTTHQEPLTPQDTERDLLAPLTHGGIAWYLEPFDPVGTKVNAERWPGSEVLRGMSEELSELDDETMNSLILDKEMEEVQLKPQTPSKTLMVTNPKKKKSARSKRRR
jgi:NuA3 HAT complex component NTO1